MADVTLHLKAQIRDQTCAVCGTRLDRSERCNWWLRNTWTSAVEHFHEGGAQHPSDWMRPCGVLPNKESAHG